MFDRIVFVAAMILTALLSGCGGDGAAVNGATPTSTSITVVADRSAALADGVDAINVTATVKDEGGNPINGKDVVFLVTGLSSPSAMVTTDEAGHAVFTVKRTAQEVATYGETVWVTAFCDDRGRSVPVQFSSRPIIELSNNGGGTFTLTAKGLVNATGMGVQVGYNSASLANPEIEWDAAVPSTSKSFTILSPQYLGIDIATSTAISGTLKIAALHFKEIMPSTIEITSFGGYLVDAAGKRVPATIVMPSPTTTSASP